MDSEVPVEKPPDVVPIARKKFRIKSLMILIGLIAAGLGWALQVERTGRSFGADGATFSTWIGGLQASNPSVKASVSSIKTSSIFFEMSRRFEYLIRTPTGRIITIHADLRSGPLHSKRRVTFESIGQSKEWPFEDIERGRSIDLKAEFPAAFR